MAVGGKMTMRWIYSLGEYLFLSCEKLSCEYDSMHFKLITKRFKQIELLGDTGSVNPILRGG